jgi:uncharacterized membrane protein
MSDLPAVTTEKLQSVKVAGWAYIAVGAAFLAVRMYNTSGLIIRLASALASTEAQPKAAMIVWIVLSTMISIALGGLLVGGGVYLLRRSASGRMTLIVTSAVLIAFSLIRVLQSAMMLLMLTHFSTGSFAAESQRQGVSGGLSLLLALALGGLLVLITRPAVKDAMLPKKATAAPPPPPVAQAMQ